MCILIPYAKTWICGLLTVSSYCCLIYYHDPPRCLSPYNSLHLDAYHMLISKYLENKCIGYAFVDNVSLTIYSIIPSVNVPVLGTELGTGESMTHSTDMIPVLMKLTLTIFKEVKDLL